MQKRLWKCDGPNCSSIREQEWEDFALGGSWKSYQLLEGTVGTDKHTQKLLDFCSVQCQDNYDEQVRGINIHFMQESSKG